MGKVIFSVLDSKQKKKKYRNFQDEFYYIAFTRKQTKKETRQTLWSRRWWFLEDPGWRKNNETIKLYCTVFLKKKNSNKPRFVIFERIAQRKLEMKQKITQK